MWSKVSIALLTNQVSLGRVIFCGISYLSYRELHAPVRIVLDVFFRIIIIIHNILNFPRHLATPETYGTLP